MKKFLSLLAILVLCSTAVKAETFARPINVQNAYIDTENKNELRVTFDWYRDHKSAGGVTSRRHTINLPRIEWRRSFDTAIPTRIGVSTGLAGGSNEVTPVGQDAAFIGFSNMGLSLEAAPFNNESGAMTLYINQTFPWIHDSTLASQALRPQVGANAYGFQVGSGYQFTVIPNLFRWYGDIAYRFDVPDSGSTQHSLVYYNEMVMNTGTVFDLSLGLLGNSVYTNDIGTDLRLVPGVIANLCGDDCSHQLRFGLPIGLNPDSNDIGFQLSYFGGF